MYSLSGPEDMGVVVFDAHLDDNNNWRPWKLLEQNSLTSGLDWAVP